MAKPDSGSPSCASELGSPTRRLTRFELAHAVEDVFGVDASSLRALPAPLASIGNVPDILVGRLLDTSPRFLVPYREAVAKVAVDSGLRLAPSCTRDKARPFGDGAEGVRRCVLESLRLPAARLWRGSLSAEELGALGSALAAPASTPPEAAALFERGVSFLLSSPHFYLLENEASSADSEAESARRFSERRLLGRLSLALWSSVPDQELLEHAERGELADEQRFQAELRRMLGDPRFSRFAEEFGRQWLRLERRAQFRPSLESRTLIEEPERLAQAHADVARFLAQQLAGERPLSELLTANEPALNPALPESSERAGLLTSKAVLSAISTPIRGGGDENWLGRGLVIQGAFLCRSFPLAAVYPSELWEGHALLNPRLTAQNPRPGEPELLAIRTSDRPCRECHRQLETLGAALSAFDGLGELAAPTLARAPLVAGQQIANARQLSTWILQSGRFEPCVAEKLLSYVLGRAVLPAKRAADRCLVQRLSDGRANAPATLAGWLWQSLTSPEFRVQGAEVVRDKPIPSPNSTLYTDVHPPLALEPSACRGFDAGALLVENCGTATCHGPGSTVAAFAVRNSETAARLLRSQKPATDGYCGKFASYLDAERPLESLVVRKLVGGAGSCGAAMPITGGPRSLGATEHACLIQWLAEQARTAR